MIHNFKINDSLAVVETSALPSSPVFTGGSGVVPLAGFQADNFELLSFLETTILITQYYTVKNTLVLNQQILLRRSITNFKLTDQLTITETLRRDLGYYYFNDQLVFNEANFTESNDHFNDLLEFQEFVVYEAPLRIKIVFNDDLSFQEELGYLILHAGSDTPIIPIDPQAPCPSFIPNELTCSFTANLETLTLTAPNKGNTDSFNIGRLNRRTRAGELILFKAKNWPAQNILTIDIPMYSCQQVLDAQKFFDKYLGKIISYRDHEDYTYQGIVTNVFEIVEQRDVSFLLHIEFTALF